MTKQYTITISDFAYETCLKDINIDNRSAYIEKLMMLGDGCLSKQLDKQLENHKANYINTLTELDKAKEEIKKLSLIVANYKNKFDKKLKKQQKLDTEEAERKEFACAKCGIDMREFVPKMKIKVPIGEICKICYMGLQTKQDWAKVGVNLGKSTKTA